MKVWSPVTVDCRTNTRDKAVAYIVASGPLSMHSRFYPYRTHLNFKSNEKSVKKMNNAQIKKMYLSDIGCQGRISEFNSLEFHWVQM